MSADGWEKAMLIWAVGETEDGSERTWRKLRWQRRWRGEGAEGSYLLLMAVRVSEGWRAIQL